jgi:pimeloyl-ACP methyl ester carboxylesterase
MVSPSGTILERREDPVRHSAKTRHRERMVHGLRVHYRESGRPAATAVVLLHGFPSSSHSFREVLPVLGEQNYVLAPDLPGFGFTDSPPLDRFEYTFERLSLVVEQLISELGVERYVLYVTDFGTPVGYHLATRQPDRVLGLVVQNGNAHEAGLDEAWDTARRFWADPTPANRAALPDWLTFEGTRDQYLGGVPAELQELVPPESWHVDWERLNRPGIVAAQFALFTDYRNHVARFGVIADYHRRRQPPCLVLWGRHDQFFNIAEVLAYHEVLHTLELHVYDGGHFLTETHGAEIAALVAAFVTDVRDRAEI